MTGRADGTMTKRFGRRACASLILLAGTLGALPPGVAGGRRRRGAGGERDQHDDG